MQQESERKLPNGYAPVLLMLGGLAAAFGVASCCALPMLLAGIGLGSAWLGTIAATSISHREILMGAAIVCLTGGVGFLWRQSRRGACVPGSICARPSVRFLTLAGLMAGFVLLYLGYRYV
jgi:mercuric ion transport protein